MNRLLDACHLHGTARADAEMKFFRALKNATEADVVNAIEAATSKTAKDPLAVALKVLSTRKKERVA